MVDRPRTIDVSDDIDEADCRGCVSLRYMRRRAALNLSRYASNNQAFLCRNQSLEEI